MQIKMDEEVDKKSNGNKNDNKNEKVEDESSVGNMENEALKRKERLKALKEKAFNRNFNDMQIDSENGKDDEDFRAYPKPIFRNYTPNDDTLRPGVLPRPKLIDIENEVKEQLESAFPKALIEKEIDLTTLAPQKVDWDLKREVDKKLKILEKRTQHAIAELIRERIEKSKNPDFAELVTVGTKSNQTEEDD